MAGKIFYRKRIQGEQGFEQPRFQLVAIANVNLKTYARHFRLHELEFIADSVGAELSLLSSGVRPEKTKKVK